MQPKESPLKQTGEEWRSLRLRYSDKCIYMSVFFTNSTHMQTHTHTKDNPKFRERNINIVFHKRALGFVDNAKKN